MVSRPNSCLGTATYGARVLRLPLAKALTGGYTQAHVLEVARGRLQMKSVLLLSSSLAGQDLEKALHWQGAIQRCLCMFAGFP